MQDAKISYKVLDFYLVSLPLHFLRLFHKMGSLLGEQEIKFSILGAYTQY